MDGVREMADIWGGRIFSVCSGRRVLREGDGGSSHSSQNQLEWATNCREKFYLIVRRLFLALDGSEAFAVKLQQLTDILFGLGGGA